jgi:hypothetical protein
VVNIILALEAANAVYGQIRLHPEAMLLVVNAGVHVDSVDLASRRVDPCIQALHVTLAALKR